MTSDLFSLYYGTMNNTLGKTYFKNIGLTPRPQQEQALKWLDDNWDKYDYFILQLPTGVGKSHFALAATQHCHSSWIATSTLQLMDQYLHTSPQIVDIRGRRNYACHYSDLLTCENGPCRGSHSISSVCKANGLCPYEKQKAEAIAAKWTITNYAYLIYCTHCGFLSAAYKGMKMPPRQVAVFDEAHNLEHHLIDFASHTYHFNDLEKFKYIRIKYIVQNDLKYNVEILNEVHGMLQAECERLKEKIAEVYTQGKFSGANKYTSKEFAEAEKLNGKLRTLDKYLQPLNFWVASRNPDPLKETRWLIEPDVANNSIQLVPLKADFVFKNYLGNGCVAEKFIFMSATIGDPNVFCEENGIPKDRTGFFETDTPFDSSKSPIIALTGSDSISTKYDMLDSQYPKICKAITSIMDTYVGEGGIIHTGNYKIAREVWKQLPKKYKDRILFKEMLPERDIKNDELLKRHEDAIKMGEASVLMSPSLMEGVDLKDDLSRWQIVVKLPFASLGDIRVKTKAKQGNWYQNDMLMKLVQACGRSTRSEADWSRTYILDSLFKPMYMKNKLPLWFKKRVVFVGD